MVDTNSSGRQSRWRPTRRECILPVPEGMSISCFRVLIPILSPPNPFSYSICVALTPVADEGGFGGVLKCTLLQEQIAAQQELQLPYSTPTSYFVSAKGEFIVPRLACIFPPRLQLVFCVFRSRAWPWLLALTFLSFPSSQGSQDT